MADDDFPGWQCHRRGDPWRRTAATVARAIVGGNYSRRSEGENGPSETVTANERVRRISLRRPHGTFIPRSVRECPAVKRCRGIRRLRGIDGVAEFAEALE